MMDVALMVAASSGPWATRRRSTFSCHFIGAFISLLAVLALFPAASGFLFVTPAVAVPVVVTPPHAPQPLTNPQLAAHPGRAGVHSPATRGPSARPLPAAPFESSAFHAGLSCAAGFGMLGVVIKFLWGDMRHTPASGPWRLTAMESTESTAAKRAAVQRSFEDVEQDPIVVAAKYNYRGQVLQAQVQARAQVVFGVLLFLGLIVVALSIYLGALGLKQNTDPVKEIARKIAEFVARLTTLKVLGWSLGTLVGVVGMVYGICRGLHHFFWIRSL
jgi:hypothetical protein